MATAPQARSIDDLPLLQGILKDLTSTAAQAALKDWLEDHPDHLQIALPHLLEAVPFDPPTPPTDDRFKHTEYAVEATWYEQNTLRCNHAIGSLYPRSSTVRWVEEPMGTVLTLGRIAIYLVNVSVSWALLEGRRVMFWKFISRVTDSKMMHNWLDQHCNPICRDGSRARCKAAYFYLCLEYIRNSGKK